MIKQRLIVACLTIVVFGAGFAGGLWSEQHRPIPPPPAPLLGEFTSGQVPDKNAARAAAAQNSAKPYDRAKLREDIDKLKPQIEAYRHRLDELDREFNAGLVALLNGEQKQIYETKAAAFQKRRAENESKATAASLAPLSEEEIARLRQRPFENAFWIVSFSERLERTTKDLKLDAAQTAELKRLLQARREKYLALVDSTPPPTFKLTSLATSVQRLLDHPVSTPAAQAKPAPRN